MNEFQIFEEVLLVPVEEGFDFADRAGASAVVFNLPVGTYEVSSQWHEDDVAKLGFPVYCVSWIPNSDGTPLCEVRLNGDIGTFVVTREMADHVDQNGNRYAEIVVNSLWDFTSVSVRRVPSSVLEPITGVWSDVLRWFGGVFACLAPIFYNAESGLTVIGYLSIGGTAVAVALLFLNFIKSWIRFGK